MKKALIFGVTGQDGAYLANFLLGKKYKVFGTSRKFSPKKSTNLNYFGIESKIQKIEANFYSHKSIRNAIHLSKPDEIYNLAGVSSVLDPFKNPEYIAKINGLSVLIILETLRMYYENTKFFQASSSEMFATHKNKLSENSIFDPKTPYAISKLFAHEMTVQYRKNFKLFVCCGILFNHESPLRGNEFVTKKIVDSMLKIKNRSINKFTLGNIDTERDWGFAGDYVQAMWKMLQQKKPDDYVIATGESNSVKDFLIKTAKLCNIKNWNDVIEFDDVLKRKIDYNKKIGDPSKAKKILKWESKTDFDSLVKLMVNNEFL